MKILILWNTKGLNTVVDVRDKVLDSLLKAIFQVFSGFSRDYSS
jgi:hypothetical protein